MGLGGPAPQPTAAPSFGGFGGAAFAAPAPAASSPDTITVFEKDGLHVTFTLSKPPGGSVTFLTCVKITLLTHFFR